jgi:pilus assembly protein CpaB
MRFAQLTALSVAIAASALAVSLSSDYMASIKPQRIIQVAPKIAMTKVVTAANPIAHGRIIKMEDLKEVEWPADLVPEGAFLSVIQVLGTDQERVALSTFTPGEVVTRKRVSAPGQRPSLALMLGPGMRAIAVRVNAVLGVGGFVMPGDRVDLLLTETVADDNPGKLRATEVLLRNVRVLAIDQQTEGPEYKPRVVSTVTLEVALRDAQKITLATTMGSISLALRSIHAPRDEKAADDIVKEQPPIPQPVAEKKTDPMRKIVVFRSAKPTEYKVPHVAASILR